MNYFVEENKDYFKLSIDIINDAVNHIRGWLDGGFIFPGKVTSSSGHIMASWVPTR